MLASLNRVGSAQGHRMAIRSPKLVRNIAEFELSMPSIVNGQIQKIVDFDWESKFENIQSPIREKRCG